MDGNTATAPGLDPATSFAEDAPRAKDGDDDTGSNGHNSTAARLEWLDKAHNQYASLQAQEDALLELHIKPIRDQKADLKREARDKHRTPTKAFNARQALFQLERENDDVMIVALNEQFQATPIGKNVDMVAAIDRANKKHAEDEAKRVAKAAKAGTSVNKSSTEVQASEQKL